jgi:hypothetical protein
LVKFEIHTVHQSPHASDSFYLLPKCSSSTCFVRHYARQNTLYNTWIVPGYIEFTPYFEFLKLFNLSWSQLAWVRNEVQVSFLVQCLFIFLGVCVSARDSGELIFAYHSTEVWKPCPFHLLQTPLLSHFLVSN